MAASGPAARKYTAGPETGIVMPPRQGVPRAMISGAALIADDAHSLRPENAAGDNAWQGGVVDHSQENQLSA